MSNPKLVLTLTLEQQEQIAVFWASHGSTGRAMLAQPIDRDGGWLLKVRMLDEARAEAVFQALSATPRECEGHEKEPKP